MQRKKYDIYNNTLQQFPIKVLLMISLASQNSWGILDLRSHIINGVCS
jgi:hypothetical protein